MQFFRIGKSNLPEKLTGGTLRPGRNCSGDFAVGGIMKRYRTGLNSFFCLLLAALLVSGCTVRLAPEHEPAIVDGLKTLSVATSTLLGKMKAGTKKADFEKERKSFYDEIVGQANGLLLLIDVRPEPKPAVLRWLGMASADDLTKKSSQDANLWTDIKKLDVPTDDQINWLLEEVARMKNADKNSDLPPEAIRAFSKPILRALKNALTYEMALDR